MEGATSSCKSSTVTTTIPCWEMEAGDASGRGCQERKSSGREMVFLIFSCASGPGAKEQGLCWSAADEQDDSGMLASGSTATCRTNCGTSHIASMLGWLLELARDQLLFYDPMLVCQTSWNCRSVVTGKSRLCDWHVHLFLVAAASLQACF